MRLTLVFSCISDPQAVCAHSSELLLSAVLLMTLFKPRQWLACPDRSLCHGLRSWPSGTGSQCGAVLGGWSSVLVHMTSTIICRTSATAPILWPNATRGMFRSRSGSRCTADEVKAAAALLLCS